MATYLGKVQIGDQLALVGSTLYGICTTSAAATNKLVTSAEDSSGKFINQFMDTIIQGTTIHIKFTQGNTQVSGLKLKVGTTNQFKDIVGNCVCEAGTIISFTFDENEKWVVNDNVNDNTTYTFSEGTTNGTINVLSSATSTTQAIAVHGLNNAAYKDVSTDLSSNTASTDLPTVSAVVSYVQDQTGGLAGLTGAMHFRGITTTDLTNTANISTSSVIVNSATLNAISGDVVILNAQEYVWTGNQWILLGDEGSYAFKTSTTQVTGVTSFTANTLPSLTTAAVEATKINSITTGTPASLTTITYTIPKVETAGTATTASVTNGILTITLGTNTVLSTTPITIQGVDSFTANVPTTIDSTAVSMTSVTNWNAGTTATLVTNSTTVVVP